MFGRKQRSESAITNSRSGLVGEPKKTRGFSLPTDWRRSRIKGIMKYLTHDESVHSTYGSERGAEPDEVEMAKTMAAPMSPGEAAIRRKIKFADILIREYDRTIGDNPSCSSGRKYFNTTTVACLSQCPFISFISHFDIVCHNINAHVTRFRSVDSTHLAAPIRYVAGCSRFSFSLPDLIPYLTLRHLFCLLVYLVNMTPRPRRYQSINTKTIAHRVGPILK